MNPPLARKPNAMEKMKQSSVRCKILARVPSEGTGYVQVTIKLPTSFGRGATMTLRLPEPAAKGMDPGTSARFALSGFSTLNA